MLLEILILIAFNYNVIVLHCIHKSLHSGIILKQNSVDKKQNTKCVVIFVPMFQKCYKVVQNSTLFFSSNLHQLFPQVGCFYMIVIHRMLRLCLDRCICLNLWHFLLQNLVILVWTISIMCGIQVNKHQLGGNDRLFKMLGYQFLPPEP